MANQFKNFEEKMHNKIDDLLSNKQSSSKNDNEHNDNRINLNSTELI